MIWHSAESAATVQTDHRVVMFSTYNYLDAVGPAIFSMFALWAAGSKRHWFVRMSVATAALLFLLLLPAYDLVVMFGTEMLFVAGGMTLWRRRVKRQTTLTADGAPTRRVPQLSLETLMLLTVFIAVGTAVIARADLRPIQWVQSITGGIKAGMAALFCAWLILGTSPWKTRLLFAIPLLLALVVAILGFGAAVDLFRYWLNDPSAGWQPQWFRWGVISHDFRAQIKIIGLAMPLICGWLLLMKYSDWMRPLGADSAPSPSPRRVFAARAVLIVWSIAVIAIPVYFFVQLIWPTFVNSAYQPSHAAGYSDLVAAGRLIDETTADRYLRRNQLALTPEQLRDEIATHADAFAMMRKAFTDPSPASGLVDVYDLDVLRRLIWTLTAKQEAAVRLQSPTMFAETAADTLRYYAILAQEEDIERHVDAAGSTLSLANPIWKYSYLLGTDELRTVVDALQEFDRVLEPWEQAEQRARAKLTTESWRRRLKQIVDDWTGHDGYASQRGKRKLDQATIRLLMTELAVAAFEREHGRPPNDLAELVPQYLAAVPEDPFGNGALRYRTHDGRDVVYSVGHDGDDDSAALAPTANRGEGDITAETQLGARR